MTLVKASWRSWTVAVDDSVKGFDLGTEHRTIRETRFGGVDTGSTPTQLVVEVRRSSGGLMPRALVGARLTSGGEPSRTSIVIPDTGRTTSSGTGRIGLLNASLLPGLPTEFAAAVMRGLTRERLPAGELRVSYGGYDPVDSSAFAFEHAGRLLANAMLRKAMQGSLSKMDLVELVRGW